MFTAYGLNGRGIGVLLPGKAKDFLFFTKADKF
jgi:hypothetical protein